MVLYDAGDDGALDAEKLITFDNDILELEFSKRICSSVSEIGVEGSRGEFVVEISFVDRFETIIDPIVEGVIELEVGLSEVALTTLDFIESFSVDLLDVSCCKDLEVNELSANASPTFENSGKGTLGSCTVFVGISDGVEQNFSSLKAIAVSS